MTQVNQGTAAELRRVRAELSTSLERLGDCLASYRDTPAGTMPLQRSLAELRQIHGTLRTIRCDGAALLAEEMRGAVRDLVADPSRTPEQALDVLPGAVDQLADYLGLLADGERDNALVFLPLINELRVARGAGVVSEGQLFVRYAQLRIPEVPAGTMIEGRAADAGRAVADRHVAAFQTALLGVLRARDVADNLSRLAEIVTAMEAATSNARGRAAFAAAAALIEVLADGDPDSDLEVKRLLGRIGHQLKTAAEKGDAALGQAPDELLYSLVYFTGRTASTGPRAAALRAEYDLESLLPESAWLERVRARLRGPDTGLVASLAAGIKAELASLREAVDAGLRNGEGGLRRSEEATAAAERAASGLGTLGLDMLRRVVLNQARSIENPAERRQDGGGALADVLRALLRVEKSLDSALAVPTDRGAASASGADARWAAGVGHGVGAVGDAPGHDGGTAQSADAGELARQFLPLHEMALLLPDATVLETCGLDCVSVTTDGPRWLLGFGEWRGSELPVVSFEAMTGAAVPARNPRSRVAVLAVPAGDPDDGRFMLVAQGEPERPAPGAVPPGEERRTRGDADLTRAWVRLNNTEAIVPDLEAVGRRIGEAMASMAGYR